MTPHPRGVRRDNGGGRLPNKGKGRDYFPSSSSIISAMLGTRSFHDAASVLLTVMKLPSMKRPVTPSSAKMRLAMGDSAAASFEEYDLLPPSTTVTLTLNFIALGLGVGCGSTSTRDMII